MQQFRIREGGFKEIRKATLLRAIPVLFASLLGTAAINILNSPDKETEISIWLKLAPWLLVLMTIIMTIAIKRLKMSYDSYTLTMSDDVITRQQLNMTTITIQLADIKEIIKERKGTFVIKGKNTTEKILVPVQIDQYDKLEVLLNDLLPVTAEVSTSLLKKYQLIISFITMGLMFVMYVASNKLLVLVTGVSTVAILSWGLYEILRNKDTYYTTKSGIWRIVMALLYIIGAMIFKLGGW